MSAGILSTTSTMTVTIPAAAAAAPVVIPIATAAPRVASVVEQPFTAVDHLANILTKFETWEDPLSFQLHSWGVEVLKIAPEITDIQKYHVVAGTYRNRLDEMIAHHSTRSKTHAFALEMLKFAQSLPAASAALQKESASKEIIAATTLTDIEFCTEQQGLKILLAQKSVTLQKTQAHLQHIEATSMALEDLLNKQAAEILQKEMEYKKITAELEANIKTKIATNAQLQESRIESVEARCKDFANLCEQVEKERDYEKAERKRLAYEVKQLRDQYNQKCGEVANMPRGGNSCVIL